MADAVEGPVEAHLVVLEVAASITEQLRERIGKRRIENIGLSVFLFELNRK